MFFTPELEAEYSSRRMKADRVEQLAVYLNDGRSAIQWRRSELDPNTGDGPQTYQEV